jgi:hypothetical protein
MKNPNKKKDKKMSKSAFLRKLLFIYLSQRDKVKAIRIIKKSIQNNVYFSYEEKSILINSFLELIRVYE